MNDGILELPSAEWLVPLLLLGLWARDSYEHELARKIADFGFEATRSGAAYWTLRQMEKEGMVVSERGALDGGPLRLRYSISESGEA